MTIRILLVEDDPVSRELIAALLASRGHDVDAIDDGFGALRMAQEKPYDLVFVDYHLPEMDGYALARLMRSLGEKSERPLKMVAITADRFGLAARRGVDSIFDSILAKPIEPEALFSFVDEFLAGAAPTEALDAFLAPPNGTEEAPRAGHTLWRVHGRDELPRVAVFPPPSATELASLEHCFEIVEAEAADGLLLLRASGLASVEAIRVQAKTYLQPLIVVDPKLAPCADVVFNVGEGQSWSAVVETLQRFDTRRRSLRADFVGSNDFDSRVAAYLYLTDRPFEFCRDEAGRTHVTYAAGFPAAKLIESVKRLAACGRVSATLEVSPDDNKRRLVISLTAKGASVLAGDGGARISG